MSKKVSKKTKRAVGVTVLSGVVTITAYALLKTTATATDTNIITTTTQNGDLDNSQGGLFGLAIRNEKNKIENFEAVPMLKTEALKLEPYTFDVVNLGKAKQVVRLNMPTVGVVSNGALNTSTTELPPNLVNVKITSDNGYEYEGKLSDIKTAAANGIGDCFILDAKGSSTEKKSFKVWAWIDENATAEDLFGSDAGNADKANGTKKLSIEFKMHATGIQYEGVFTQTTGEPLINEYIEALKHQ